MLAQELDCKIAVDPEIKKPLTIRVVDTPVFAVLATVCRSISCEYRFDGKDLFIMPLSGGRKKQMTAMEEQSRKLESRLPEGMRFDDIPLKKVLDTISKTCRLKIRPWADEGNRKVTIHVGGKTVDQALEAIVRQIQGEGVVMIETWGGSLGQRRYVEKPLEPRIR